MPSLYHANHTPRLRFEAKRRAEPGGPDVFDLSVYRSRSEDELLYLCGMSEEEAAQLVGTLSGCLARQPLAQAEPAQPLETMLVPKWSGMA